MDTFIIAMMEIDFLMLLLPRVTFTPFHFYVFGFLYLNIIRAMSRGKGSYTLRKKLERLRRVLVNQRSRYDIEILNIMNHCSYGAHSLSVSLYLSFQVSELKRELYAQNREKNALEERSSEAEKEMHKSISKLEKVS